MKRREWEAYLSSTAARWLYVGAGGMLEPSALTPLEAEKLSQQFRYADLVLLSEIYHLCRADTLRFFQDDLPDLMRTLSRTRSSNRHASRLAGRGKIQWPATVRERTAGRIDRASFIVDRPVASVDLPENQLLKWYLVEISQLVHHVERELGGVRHLPPPIRSIKLASNRVLRAAVIREVASVPHPTPRMAGRAERSRNALYGRLCDRAFSYRDAVGEGDWETRIRLLADGWFLPIEDDRLFELFVLTWVLEVLQSELGFELVGSYGLLRPGRSGPVAEFEGRGRRIKIYFDQSPTKIVGVESEYRRVISAYDGLPRVSSPRPDLTLVAEHGGPEGPLILEVKDSEDDRYMRSSVYKVLAYLRDFAELWPTGSDQAPKAMLVFPGKISPVIGGTPGHSELEILGAGDSPRLRALLRGWLEAS